MAYRVELRSQPCFMLILLRFSVQRSAFEWHSWVALIGAGEYPKAARNPSPSWRRSLGLRGGSCLWPRHGNPSIQVVLGGGTLSNRRPTWRFFGGGLVLVHCPIALGNTLSTWLH